MRKPRSVMRIARGGYVVACIPVLQDNFVYLVCDQKHAIAIDAGEAAPVIDYLDHHDLKLVDVLLTHQHGDHAACYQRLRQQINEESKDHAFVSFEVLALPGHTSIDAGYYFPVIGVVFTGDCLINGACGRVLGGTFDNLYQSLQRIKALPAETLVLGGHDYLEDNLRFGLDVASDDHAIRHRLAQYEADPQQALFVTLAEELASNVFLQAPDYASFTKLRKIKDRY